MQRQGHVETAWAAAPATSTEQQMLSGAGDRRHPPSRLSTLLAEVQARGLSVEAVLDGTGLDRDAVDNPFTLTSCAQYLRASRNAVRLDASGELGVHVGERMRASHYGMYGYALLCSETLQQVWTRAVAYHPLSGGMLPLRWGIEGDEVVWVFPSLADFPWPDVDEALYRFMIDLQFAAHVTIGRDVMGADFSPARATFAGPPPRHAAELERVLRCPLSFNEVRNTLCFPVDCLQRAPHLANPVTASHVSMQCARLLDELRWNAGTTRQVYGEITRVPGHFPEIEEVAARLCTTSRTLRRRLEAEGATFSELLTAVRKTLAIDYLTTTRMSTEDIAEALGFSDVVAFRHAFKRWTQLTPKAYREAQAQASASGNAH